jgi:hypothetical protein
VYGPRFALKLRQPEQRARSPARTIVRPTNPGDDGGLALVRNQGLCVPSVLLIGIGDPSRAARLAPDSLKGGESTPARRELDGRFER